MRLVRLLAAPAILALSVVVTPMPAFSANLDATAAQAVVAGCARHAAAKSQSHSIVVVDLGGGTVAALRMDRTGRGIMDFARAKAEAVAAWGFTTGQMESNARETPGFAAAPHVVTVAGGVPVYSADGRERIGAVGVSGEAPADDEACARAGITAAGLRDARVR